MSKSKFEVHHTITSDAAGEPVSYRYAHSDDLAQAIAAMVRVAALYDDASDVPASVRPRTLFVTLTVNH